MDLSKAIKRVERYRDDIVTHGMTREAMSTVIETARKYDEEQRRLAGRPQGMAGSPPANWRDYP